MEYGLVGATAQSSTTVASSSFFGTFGSEGALTNPTTTEASAQLKFRGAGTLSHLYVNVPTNGRSSASTVVVRKNGADTSLAVSIGAGQTGVFSDITGSATFADGDLWNYAVSTGAGGGGLVVAGLTARLAVSGQVFTQQAGFGTLTATVSRALGFAGMPVSTSSGSIVGVRAMQAATLSRMQLVVTANASSGFTAKLSKNGADGNQAISVGAGLTGLFEDISNSDTVAAGDYYNLSMSAPSASVTITAAAVKTVGTVANRVPVDCGTNNSALAAGATQYSGLWGRSIRASSEASVQSPMPCKATLSALSIFVRTNASTTSVNFKLRVNGVDGTQVVSVPALTTGLYQDLTHTDAVVAGDLISSVISGATTGSVDTSWMGMLVTTNVAPINDDNLMLLGVG